MAEIEIPYDPAKIEEEIQSYWKELMTGKESLPLQMKITINGNNGFSYNWLKRDWLIKKKPK